MDFNGFEFKQSRSFSDPAQRSLGLNVLKSFLTETDRLMTITSKLLITRAGINCQVSLKFGHIVH